MTTKHSILSVLVIALLVFGTGAFADVYVNGLTGNDLNAGTIASPVKTMKKAITVLNGQAAPTTLHIVDPTARTYSEAVAGNQIIQITVNGTAANKVTIQTDNPAQAATMQGIVFDVLGTFVVIKDLVFDANSQHEACVVVRNTAADCLIQNCQFTGVSEQGAEHFNTDTNDVSEPVDVAPIQVMSAARTTVSGCGFGAAGQVWDYAILHPGAVGSGNSLLVSGCVINGGTGTGGVGIGRTVHNTRIENTQFNDLTRAAVNMTNRGTIDSSTMVGLFVQNCTVNGFGISGTNGSTDAAVRLVDAHITGVDIRNVTFNWFGVPTGVTNGGMDGVGIVGATVENLTVSGCTFNRNAQAYNGEFAVTFRSGTGTNASNGSYVTGVTVENCNATISDFMQVYESKAANVMVRNCVSLGIEVCRAEWTAFGVTTLKNFTFLNHTHNQIYGAARDSDAFDFTGGVTVDGLTLDGCNITQKYGTDTTQQGRAIAMWSNISTFRNITVRNSTIIARTNAFFVGNTVAENILFEDSTFDGGDADNDDGRHTILAGYEGTGWNGITIRRCNIDCTVPGAIGTWNSAISIRVGNCVMENGLFEDLTITGARAFGFLDAGRKNFVLRRIVSNTQSDGIKAAVGAPLEDCLIEDCTFEAATGNGWLVYKGLSTFGPPTLPNMVIRNSAFIGGTGHGMDITDNTVIENFNVSNTLFEGRGSGLGGGSMGIKMEVGGTIDDATFDNCRFVYSGPIDDVTNIRMGGFLLEDDGTTLSNMAFHDCTFSGGNAGFMAQRYVISDGPDFQPQPVLTNVLFDNCTFANNLDRGISLHFARGSNLVFDNPTITGTQRGWAAYCQWNGTGLRFINPTITGNAGGFNFQTSIQYEAPGWKVIGGTLTGIAGTGVRIGLGPRNLTLSGLSMEGVAGSAHGIFMDNTAGAVAGAKLTRNNTVSNVSIDGFDNDGIRCHGSGTTITGCTIENCGGTGVYMQDGPDTQLRSPLAGVTVTTSTIMDCGTAGVISEGTGNTISYNTIARCGEGVRVRNGLSNVLLGSGNTRFNTVMRNCVVGGAATTMGIREAANPGYTGDPGPTDNVYLNNTVTDWGGHGTEFMGRRNRIQNNIFAFNGGSGLRIVSPGLSGLKSGFNCASQNAGTDFDGIGIDFTKDMWRDPLLVSRDPSSPNFYLLDTTSVPPSPCLDAGTLDGNNLDTTPDAIDMGCKESGAVEVASWRLY